MTLLLSHRHGWAVLLACAVLASFRPITAVAFSARTTVPRTSCRDHRGRKISILYSSLSSVGADGSPNKIEAVGVQRFTRGYDKLCKSCPTRIQPRVDTLTEMIMGLPDIERDKLMQILAERLPGAQDNSEAVGKVTSSREVYEFQTAGVAVKPDRKKKKTEAIQKANGEGELFAQSSLPENSAEEDEAKPLAKLLKKRDKVKKKFRSSKQDAARVLCLVAASKALLSGNNDIIEPIGWYHDFDELKLMSRAELKMEHLKFMSQKAKHEQKIAKQRMKLYAVNVVLADARARMRVEH